MRLVSLKVVRLPGIAPDFTLDSLDAGVNILTGPNASGKSSVVRAVRALLYAEEAKGQGVYIEGEFEDGGVRLNVQRVGDTISWQRDGVAIDPPGLAESRFLSCYLIRLEDLSGTVDGDGEITLRIARELSGGYDLAAARGHSAFKPRNAGQTEKNALVHARKQLSAARRRSESLYREESELEGLERRKIESQRARGETQALSAALGLSGELKQLATIEAQQETFPTFTARLHGNELERLDELLNDGQTARDRLVTVRTDLQAAERQLKESGLADAGLDRGDLDEARALLNEVRSLEPKVEACRNREAAARTVAIEVAAQLGAPVDGDMAVTPDEVTAAEAALEKKRGIEASIRAAESSLDQLAEAVEGEVPDLEGLRGARRSLLGWLASPEPAGGRFLLAALLMLLGTLGFALPWLVAGLPLAPPFVGASGFEVAWATASGTLFVAGLSLLLFGRRGRGEYRKAFERTGVRVPEEWKRAAVLTRLDRLGSEIAAAEELVRQFERHKEITRNLRQLEAQRDEQMALLATTAERVGFDPARLDESFALWLGLVRDHGKARKDATGAAAEADEHEKRWRKAVQPLLALLDRYGEAPALETVRSGEASQLAFRSLAGILEARLNSLEGRLKARDEARGAIEERMRLRQQLEEDLSNCEAAADRHIADLGLGSQDRLSARGEIRAGLDMLDDWKRLEEKHRQHVWRVQEYRTTLNEREELLALAESGDDTVLQERLEAHRRLADQYEDVVGRISEVQERIRNARQERELEKAVAAEQLAEDELTRRLEETLFAEAGKFLLEQVQAEHNQASRPEALEDASTLFRRFTRNRYGLEFDLDGQSFRGREQDTGALLPLDHLSTGTKAQLLLAVRVAFAGRLERGRLSLPLFLDEALTTADPERFKAVTESLRLLAAEGRQIFYLSARPEDAVYWAADGSSQPKVIDISQIRRSGASAQPASLTLPAHPSIPAPAGLEAEEYAAQLGVPPLEPWGAPEAVHLFHLLRDDLELLFELLSVGIERLGPLESYLASADLTLLPTVEQEQRLLARCRAARAWIEGWRIGRGRPLERQGLVDSDAVSSTFIDRVDEVRESVNGRGRDLIEKLRDRVVKGFQTAKIDDLEAWLHDNDYLDERPTLSADELPRFVAEAVIRESEQEGTRPTVSLRREVVPVEIGSESGGQHIAESGDRRPSDFQELSGNEADDRLAHRPLLEQAELVCRFFEVGASAVRVTEG